MCYYCEECTETRLRQFSGSLVFAVEHQRKTNSNLSPAVFPQLQSERLLAGGEGQRPRPARYQRPPVLSGEGGGRRGEGHQEQRLIRGGGVKGKSAGGGRSRGGSGLHSYTSKHRSAGVCWQKVEHLGRVSCEEVKVWRRPPHTSCMMGTRGHRLIGSSAGESLNSPSDDQ